MSSKTDTRTPTLLTVKELVEGDEIVYCDGNQVVTKIERFITIDFKAVYDIYVEGVATPRRQPGRAPITVLREA